MTGNSCLKGRIFCLSGLLCLPKHLIIYTLDREKWLFYRKTIIFLCLKLFFQQVRAEKCHVMRTFSLPLSTLFHLLGRYQKISPAKMNLFIQLYNCNYLTVTVYVPAVSPVRSVSVARLTNSTLHFFVPVMVIVSSLPDFLTLIVVSAFAFMS